MPKNLGLYNDNLSVPRKQDVDAVASRVNTNEDNIAMLDSDMEAAQGDITTLKGNVTTLTTALQSKQDKIVGGASTITDDNLVANRALVSNGSGKVAVSAVTATELGYLDGVTSNVQTQLNKKLESAPVTSVNTKTGAVVLGASDVGAVAISDVTQTLGTSTTKVPSEKAVADALSGAGAGDMLKATYDPTGSVETAGGIPDYVAGQLPMVNDATLTIQKNGTAVGTFTANASANKSINITMAKGDVGLSNVDNVKQYSADNPPPYPVTSVAGKTGKVTLTKSNVGLGNVDNVKQYSASNPPPYPVTSVNDKTGAVNLSASDVGAVPTSRTVNGHSLSNNVTITKSDVGLGSVANERQYSANNPPPYPVTSVNGKTGAVTVSVPTVPTTTSLLKGNGSGGLVAATAGTDYALLPTTRKVTLTASGWNSSTKQQTVTCSGVLSDATKQLLIPTPVNTAAGNPYDEASIQMVAQGANSVTFYAETVPTVGIDVYVTIYPINYLG